MIYSEGVTQVMSKYVFLVAALMVSSIAMSWNSPGDVPAAGSIAPTFKLVTNEGKEASLSDFKGKWVVLYFYPKDFTSGCTLEAHNFQRDLDKYTAANAAVIGVSVDSPESHKQFCEKESLNFKLLADTEKTVSTQYGTTMEYNGQTY